MTIKEKGEQIAHEDTDKAKRSKEKEGREEGIVRDGGDLEDLKESKTNREWNQIENPITDKM